MAKRRSQSQHDQMVKFVIDYLLSNNFSSVKADLSGFTKPAKITWESNGQGHIPDVTAEGKESNLFEIETEDSIFDDHTADQWSLFAAYSQQHGKQFWVVVPHGSVKSAQSRLTQLGIQAEVWTVG